MEENSVTTGNSPELIIHVGLPKTGTTAIQRYMFTNRNILKDHGIFWAETYPNGVFPINDWAHHVYSHKWGGWLDVSKFIVTPDEAWSALGKAIRQKGGRHLISSERFADLLPLPVGDDMLSFIVETVAPARVKIIGYVRRQDDLIESHIRELVKGGNFSMGITTYLSNLPSFFSFDKSFIKAAEFLGRENVMVRVYERDRLVHRDAVADFLQTIQIPKIEVAENHDQLINLSLNTLTSKILSDPRIIETFQKTPYRRHFVEKFLNQETFKHLDRYALLDANTRAELMKYFEAGNARLAEMFLCEDDAKSLLYDATSDLPTIKGDDFIITYQQLVDLLVTFRPPMQKTKYNPSGKETLFSRP